MDFYIPKYTDIYVRDGHMGMSIGCKGEYRAILIGEDGRPKSDSGWKPNTLLDNYFHILRYGDPFSRIYLGDSDIAVNVTQTSLQGSQVGTYEYLGSASYKVNAGLPNYERITIEQGTWAPGESTGTIKEFVIASAGGAHTSAMVRVVLATPIVKGSGDQLTIQHRFTWYPQIVESTGVIDISGVDYNWAMQCTNAASVPFGHPGRWYTNTGAYGYLKTGEMGLITAGYTQGNQCGYPNSTSAVSYGGSLPDYYTERTYTVGVDQGNSYSGLIRSWYTDILGPNDAYGLQMRWGKVSDDSVLQKLNTHVLTFGVRLTVSRHVP